MSRHDLELLRKKHSMSYDDLAKIAGVSRQLVFYWEKGTKAIPEHRADMIQSHFYKSKLTGWGHC